MDNPNYELAKKVHDAFVRACGLTPADHSDPGHNEAWLAAAKAAREHIAKESLEAKGEA